MKIRHREVRILTVQGNDRVVLKRNLESEIKKVAKELEDLHDVPVEYAEVLSKTLRTNTAYQYNNGSLYLVEYTVAFSIYKNELYEEDLI